MNILPVQITEEGVLIPRTYLHEAVEVEVVVTDEYVLVKAKPPAAESKTTQRPARKPHRFSFIASGRTRNPRASQEAEEILEREVKRHAGWSVEK